MRVKVRAVVCSSNPPSSFTADVYVRPFWIGSVTFYYSYSSGGCAYYRTVDVTFRPSLLPPPYALLGTTDLAIGPLPPGTSLQVYELYIAGMRRPEFNRPASPMFEGSKWLDATYVMDGVLRVEAETDLTAGRKFLRRIIVRLSLSPIVTPSGVIPLRSGTHLYSPNIYCPVGTPSHKYQVEGRTTTTLSDELLRIVRYINGALSALGYVIDRWAQDMRVKAAYKVVTFAGQVAENALQNAKTTVSVGSQGTVYINVGWEERQSVVLVWLNFEFSQLVSSCTIESGLYYVEGLVEASYLDAYTSLYVYQMQDGIDKYTTWYCLYQQPEGNICDPRYYR